MQVRATSSGQTDTVWVPTDILRVFEEGYIKPEKRYLIFLDEVNRCREVARNGILAAIDSTRKMYNPLTGANIHLPENILWVVAINNGSQNTGKIAVDPAQLNRFAPLKMNYPPEKEELRILSRHQPGVDRSRIQRVVQTANAIRKDDQLRVDLSVRATEEVCTLLGHPHFADFEGDPVPELLKTSFCGRFAGRWDDPTSEAGLVWQVIVRTLAL